MPRFVLNLTHGAKSREMMGKTEKTDMAKRNGNSQESMESVLREEDRRPSRRWGDLSKMQLGIRKLRTVIVVNRRR